MTTAIEYALMAGASYISTRPDPNKFPTPQGWVKVVNPDSYVRDPSSGFEAISFTNGTEIVISYAGTYDVPLNPFTNPDLQADIGLATGFGSEQLLQAAEYYVQVKMANPDAVINFTGHSLGGGLAALMGVFFKQTAVTFDQAPFMNSATQSIAMEVMSDLLIKYSPDANLQITGILQPLADFIATTDLLADSLPARAANVTGLNTQGEFLSVAPLTLFDKIGTQDQINHGPTDVGGTDLHAQSLLTAFLQSGDTPTSTASDHTLGQVTFKLTDLLGMIFDKNLFAYDSDKDKENLLEHLLRHEAGVRDPATGAISIPADAMVTRFTADLWKIARDGGLTLDEAHLGNALIAFAMEKYYGEKAGGIGQGATLFQDVSGGGGIQFDTAAIVGEDNSIAGAKGYDRYFQNYIDSTDGFTPAEKNLVADTLPSLRDWYVQAGNGGMSAADTRNNGAFMLGGKGTDALTGGTGNDLLAGGAGNDKLTGGRGDDILIGGKDYDTYYYREGDGNDRIADEDRQGRLIVRSGDNARHYDIGLLIKDEGGAEIWTSADNKITLTHNFPWTLHIEGGGSIELGEEFGDGDLGIQLFQEETLSADYDRTILGDLVVGSDKDDLGNYIPTGGAAPGREDGFHDSAGNDLIRGLGGNDFIYSWRGGDDRIEGGDGDDWMVGGMGKDIVIGGAGRDVIVEGGGDDKLYADEAVTLEAAIAAGEGAGSGLQGEALSGGGGDDLVIGGAGNDVLLGGTGDDILVGGAGDDDIDGDAIADNIMRDWSVQRLVETVNGATSYTPVYDQFYMDWPTEGGDDVIYAGAGEDWVSAGYGNDYVDGGSGNDKLWGEGGHDSIFGGAGNDLIMGDNANLPVSAHGDDYLDGEEGDDTLFGEGGSDHLFGGTGNDKLYGDSTVAGAGYDYLDGGDGDDILLGGALDDALFGGEGNDFLQGDSGTGSNDGDDYLDGGDGDDILLGEGGRDEIHGGDGADQIAGDNGGTDTSGDADTIFGGAGNDIIDGQGGDDVIDGGADDDLIAGGEGNDSIMGGTGNDQLQGGAGDDTLEGGDGTDILFGEDGNDPLRGGAGADYLIGGAGNDILDGGAGDDVYYYSLGEGSDRIVDSGGTDWLVFTDIRWNQLTLGTGSLKINLPDGAALHLDDFDADNPYAAGGIEYFQFGDGTAMSKNQLINALGIQPTGTPEADQLSGTALSETIRALAGDDVVTARGGNDTVYAGDGADTVYGGDGNDILDGGNGDDVLLGENGNDTLYGEAGNDLLSGGAGTDTLQGGEGDDTYLFHAGDGQDTIIDTLGANAVVLGAGLTLGTVAFTRQGDDLLIAVKNSTDRLTVKNWFAADSHFTGITLGDGATLDHAGVEAAMPRNLAPVAAQDTAAVTEDGITTAYGNALANDSDPEGRTLRVTNPGTYAGAAGTLTLGGDGAYSYTLANGSHMVQSLAAGQTLTETFAYTASDDDPNGAASASSNIVVTVTGSNDAPVAAADSARVSEDGIITAGGNVLANDRDADAGDTLQVVSGGTIDSAYGTLALAADGTYVYTLDNESALVQSLGRNAQVTERFDYSVSDGIAAVASSLSVTVTGANDAPVVAAPLADQTVSANSSYSWKIPAGSFADADYGDVLVYAAALADGTPLPTWLAFDAATQTFSGRAPRDAAGYLYIGITTTDGIAGQSGNLSASDIFRLSFASGGGGGGGNGGNAGVGNGQDAPPPGQTYNFNDGADTMPGNPGARGGNGHRPDIPAAPPGRPDIVPPGMVGAVLEHIPAHAAAGQAHVPAASRIQAPDPAGDRPQPGKAGPLAASGEASSQPPKRASNASQAVGDAAQPQERAPLADNASAAGAYQDSATPQNGGDHASRRFDELIRAWFDEPSASEQFMPLGDRGGWGAWESRIERQVNRSVSGGISGDVSSEWARMNARLKKHLEQTGADDGLYAESGAGARPFGLAGSGGQQRVPGLGAGSAQQMKEFAGLKEGLESLGV